MATLMMFIVHCGGVTSVIDIHSDLVSLKRLHYVLPVSKWFTSLSARRKALLLGNVENN